MTAWLAGGTGLDVAPSAARMRIDMPWLAGRRAGPQVDCRLVFAAADLAAHLEIRSAVFVAEQRVFAHSDRDAHDSHPSTLHVLGLVDGVPAGTVRLFPVPRPANPAGRTSSDEPDRHGEPDWQGDRLAVLPRFRSVGLGAPLVRFAVTTAGSRGGRRMVAHVQPPNRTFFRRLGWSQRGEPEIYVGLPHLRMEIDLHRGGHGG